MIVAPRNAIILASVLLLTVTTMQWASAHGIEDNAQGNYAFGPTVKNLALAAKLEQPVVNVGAPIPIKFAITNFGPPIRIFRIGWLVEYTVTGTGPGGVPIKRDDRGAGSVASVDTGMDLANGSTYVNPVHDLGRLYDLRTPGRYTFTCGTALTLAYEGPVFADLRSTALTLDVR
jgi:hypothetical protein